MKIITHKNIYFSLITLLSLTISVNAFAQQNSIFQQVYRAPKELSNLAPATQFAESFLGQDKSGPYILTWKNINFGPGNPVWISVDNNILTSAEYSIDIAKGEITFFKPLKRTQVIKISYFYYYYTFLSWIKWKFFYTTLSLLFFFDVSHLNLYRILNLISFKEIWAFNAKMQKFFQNFYAKTQKYSIQKSEVTF